MKKIDSLIQTIRLISKDIGMEFGINKCTILVMKRGQVIKSEGIQIPDCHTGKSLKKEKSYKYLGVLESEKVLVIEMQTKID